MLCSTIKHQCKEVTLHCVALLEEEPKMMNLHCVHMTIKALKRHDMWMFDHAY